MDWFHCNQCFTRRESTFAVSSCGHICCQACIQSKQCSICGAACSYLPITDQMKPQEKVFFKDPVKLIQSRLEHISQVALFQRTQMERVSVHFRHKSAELEGRLKEVNEQGYRQLSELKRENTILKRQLSELKRETAELKKPLSQRRVSPAQFQTDGALRTTLPVAVTSPVTPRSRTIRNVASSSVSSAQQSPRGGPETAFPFSPPTQVLTPTLGTVIIHSEIKPLVLNTNSLQTPGSATSVSSHTSLREYGQRTPTAFSTSTRRQHHTPVFQFPFTSGLSVRSPRR